MFVNAFADALPFIVVFNGCIVTGDIRLAPANMLDEFEEV